MHVDWLIGVDQHSGVGEVSAATGDWLWQVQQPVPQYSARC